MFTANVIREFAVVKNRLLIMRAFVTLYQNLAKCNPWNQVHHFFRHAVSCSDYCYSGVVFAPDLEIKVIINIAGWALPLFWFATEFLTDSFFDQQSHDPV